MYYSVLQKIKNTLKEEFLEIPDIVYMLFVLANIDYRNGNQYLIKKKEDYANKLLETSKYKVFFSTYKNTLKLEIIDTNKHKKIKNVTIGEKNEKEKTSQEISVLIV